MSDDVSKMLNGELEALTMNLKQNRDKFVTQWAGEEMQKLTNSLQKTHDQNIMDDKDQIRQHQNKIGKLQEQSKTDMKALEERMGKLQELKTELQKLETETDEILRQRESAEIALNRSKQNIEKEKEYLALQRRASQQKLVELDKAGDMFSQRLDFKFKKISGGRLQFIFTSIDREDPDAAFYFFLKVEGEDRKYIVSGCEPPVQDMELLVDKLNATNNLKSFVVSMRKRFQQIALERRS